MRLNEHGSFPKTIILMPDDGHISQNNVVAPFKELFKTFQVLRKVCNTVACKIAHQ
jgi:hypothetical protein